jgi:hypothetical protein
MAAISNKHPEIPHYSTQSDDLVSNPMFFRVKEFIEMVN